MNAGMTGLNSFWLSLAVLDSVMLWNPFLWVVNLFLQSNTL